jgi:histidinol dehydrogenase
MAVRDQVAAQLATLSRGETIRATLETRSGAVVVNDLNEALDLANEYAPEHLCLLTAEPWALVGRVRNAGGVFVGEMASEALGDYAMGPSHIMPTAQTARFSSPVNVWDFVKITSVFAVGPQVVRQISPAAIAIAETEGLTAHVRAMRMRIEGTDGTRGEES